MACRSSLRTKGNVPSLAERLPDHHSLAPMSTSGFRADSTAHVTSCVSGSTAKQVLTVVRNLPCPKRAFYWGSLETAMEITLRCNSKVNLQLAKGHEILSHSS